MFHSARPDEPLFPALECPATQSCSLATASLHRSFRIESSQRRSFPPKDHAQRSSRPLSLLLSHSNGVDNSAVADENASIDVFGDRWINRPLESMARPLEK